MHCDVYVLKCVHPLLHSMSSCVKPAVMIGVLAEGVKACDWHVLLKLQLQMSAKHSVQSVIKRSATDEACCLCTNSITEKELSLVLLAWRIDLTRKPAAKPIHTFWTFKVKNAFLDHVSVWLSRPRFTSQFFSAIPQIIYNDCSSWKAHHFDLWPFCGANRVPNIIILLSLIIFPEARQAARQTQPLFSGLHWQVCVFLQIIMVLYFWLLTNQHHIKLRATIKVRWSSGWTGR